MNAISNIQLPTISLEDFLKREPLSFEDFLERAPLNLKDCLEHWIR